MQVRAMELMKRPAKVSPYAHPAAVTAGEACLAPHTLSGFLCVLNLATAHALVLVSASATYCTIRDMIAPGLCQRTCPAAAGASPVLGALLGRDPGDLALLEGDLAIPPAEWRESQVFPMVHPWAASA